MKLAESKLLRPVMRPQKVDHIVSHRLFNTKQFYLHLHFQGSSGSDIVK